MGLFFSGKRFYFAAGDEDEVKSSSRDTLSESQFVQITALLETREKDANVCRKLSAFFFFFSDPLMLRLESVVYNMHQPLRKIEEFNKRQSRRENSVPSGWRADDLRGRKRKREEAFQRIDQRLREERETVRVVTQASVYAHMHAASSSSGPEKKE